MEGACTSVNNLPVAPGRSSAMSSMMSARLRRRRLRGTPQTASNGASRSMTLPPARLRRTCPSSGDAVTIADLIGASMT